MSFIDSISSAEYEVYHHPLHKFSTVKRGFIWPAFLFPYIWLVYRRCYFSLFAYWFYMLVVVVFVNIICRVLFDAPTGIEGGPATWVIGSTLAAIGFGFFAQRLAANKLIARGFKRVGKYQCKTGDAAIAMVYKRKKK